MTSEHTVEYREMVFASLKGFQRKTAEYVFERLYRAEGQHAAFPDRR